MCVYVCLCPCSAAPFPFALQPLFRCAAIIGFLATDRCLVPWRVYTDSALAPCLNSLSLSTDTMSQVEAHGRDHQFPFEIASSITV